MISLYTGPGGSGKTYHAVCEILDYLHRGKHVFSNFELQFSQKEKVRKVEEKYYHYQEDITPVFILAEALKNGLCMQEDSGLLVIDEAGYYLNTRNNDYDKFSWVRLLSIIRHLGLTTIIVCISDSMIDRQLRVQAEYEIKHFTVRNLWYMKFIPVNLHFAVRHWYGVTIKGKIEPFVIQKYIAKRYNTMKIFSLEDFKKEVEGVYGKEIPEELKRYFIDDKKEKKEIEKPKVDNSLIEEIQEDDKKEVAK